MSAGIDLVLRLLQEHYGGRRRIIRTESLWIAVATDPAADHAPTVVQPDVDAFVREMENPPSRMDRSASLLSSEWVRDHSEQRGDGAYRYEGPPVT